MRHTILLAVLLLSPLAALHASDGPRKPNFLFIYTDDQRYDALSVVQAEQGEKARFPWLKTPNLDRIAAEGVRFRNAFVVNSLCSPSRASFLTGCYGHVNGIINNHTSLAETSVTHASLLRQAGYATGYIGKWHMGRQSGQRPGFDFSASFVGQGKYFDCPFEVNGQTTPTTGWVDDVSTDYAGKFIRERKDKPFLLVLGFKTCHGPFTPPPRHADTYGEALARTVPNFATKAIYRQDGEAGGAKRKRAKLAQPGPPDEQGRVTTNLGAFRGITAVDENVGRLLKLLDELQIAGDTMVIFASDNGYYLGEHGLGDKRSAYEESIRIPLLVRYPRLQARGKLVDQFALNVDLAPTLLDFAGVAVPKTMHGRSWRPLLEGRPAADWRNAFFYCYFREGGFDTPMVTAVRTESAKLIKYPGHDEWTELFDLKADAYETKNLAKDPAFGTLKEQLEAEYQKQSAAIAFRIPDFADKAQQPAKNEKPARKKGKKQ
ncbi:MAG: sulfatase [Verrucomicrobia bacterium]|nr:sulfatase [Verrucomicrobiota bacterium]